jgi:penicillin V acylase-like amidase (Ntn superfamily)
MIAATVLLITPIAASACTALVYIDSNGKAYKGRSMDFPFKLPTSLTFIPSGFRVQSVTPNGGEGLGFDTIFPILGLTLEQRSGHGNLVFLDGMNDQGLSFSANQQNHTISPKQGPNANNTLAIGDLGSWILGNFKTVQEVKAAIEKIDLWLPVSLFYGNVITPLHYAIWDKSGEGLVLEFLDGKTGVFDNPVGVLTNGPSFSWHLTNLNNYTTGNINQNIGKFGNLRVQADDAGNAMTNLPSAQTAAGRFVKAAYYVNYVRKAKTPSEAIQTVAQIMNNFDRPYDLTIDIGDGLGNGLFDKGRWSDATQWIVLNDLSQNVFYVRSIDSMNWTIIDFDQIKNGNTLKSTSVFDLTARKGEINFFLNQ